MIHHTTFEVPSVPRLIVTLDLPIELLHELRIASQQANIPPHKFAAECVESAIAQRRMNKLPPTTKHATYTSPRMAEFKEG
jgi:hypothetical protein